MTFGSTVFAVVIGMAIFMAIAVVTIPLVEKFGSWCEDKADEIKKFNRERRETVEKEQALSKKKMEIANLATYLDDREAQRRAMNAIRGAKDLSSLEKIDVYTQQLLTKQAEEKQKQPAQQEG